MKNVILLIVFLSFSLLGVSQNISVEGYVFEEGNRGFINLVTVQIVELPLENIVAEIPTNKEGFFTFEASANKQYRYKATKSVFKDKIDVFDTKNGKEKVFLKIEMERKPGYLFDATIAPRRDNEDLVVDAITGAQIEIYNNTKKKEELVLKNHPSHTFSFTFEQGNHYTLLLRKKGFFNKRMEANVNVNGCILCFEGIGSVEPGVSDNLTKGLTMGTLVANIEMQPIKLNESIEIKNIYYDLGKYRIKSESKLELDKLISVLKDNPSLIVELSSHTDSRGEDGFNMSLSQKRASACVDYILKDGSIKSHRIVPKGFGESSLLNKCENGVDCSEEEHKLNRRTEIKVTGVLSLDPYEQLSLAQILHRENFEEMLDESDSFESIKVTDDASKMPDDLKAYIAKQKAEAAKAKANTDPEGALSDAKIKEILSKEEAEVSTKATTDKSNKKGQIVIEEGLNIKAPVFKARNVAKSFGGFSIQIVESLNPLSSDDPIFKAHGDIIVDEFEPSKFGYMIGEFNNSLDAYDFMKSVLSYRYPAAKVVSYVKGMRVDHIK